MNIYKLKVGVVLGEDEIAYKDLWFDVNQIVGWYIPENTPEDEHLGAGITILFNGDTMTVVQEPHIVAYLKERFVDVAMEK